MAKLLERTVQKRALDYLANYYKKKAKRRRLFDKMEVRTKRRYGGKRADGFVAFKRRFRKKVYVVSMESKSYKTQDVINPKRDNKLWIKNSLWLGAYIALGTGVIFLVNYIEGPIWSLIYALGTWLVVSLVIGQLTKNSAKNKTMGVLKQIDQYPGNEQWLSTSKDSYDAIPVHLQSAFVKICKARGIGLLLVDKRKRIILIHKPKKRRKLFGSYLKYYSIEKDVKKYLD